jgi:hypothetical protein
MNTKEKDIVDSWLYRFIKSIDQLMNVICGGDPDLTISARVGFYSLLSKVKRNDDKEIGSSPAIDKVKAALNAKDQEKGGSNVHTKGDKKTCETFIDCAYECTEKLIDKAYEHAQPEPHCLDAYEYDLEEEPVDKHHIFYLIKAWVLLLPVCWAVGGAIHILKALGFRCFSYGDTSEIDNKKERILPVLFLNAIGITIAGLILSMVFALIIALLIVVVIADLILGPIVFILIFLINLIPRSSKSKESRSKKSRGEVEKYTEIQKIIVRKRLVRKTKEFQNILKMNGQQQTGLSIKSDPNLNLVIALDMLQEIFGYHKYSRIKLCKKSLNKSNVLIFSIEGLIDSFICIYPKGLPSKEDQIQKLANNSSIPNKENLILTDSIEWRLYEKDRTPGLKNIYKFNFMGIDTNEPDDIEMLYKISSENLRKSLFLSSDTSTQRA